MTERLRALLLAAFAALPCPGCGPSSPPTAAVRVFAAASLTLPITRIARAFEASHPGMRVEVHLAGSAQLALQLREGARADVFVSADDDNMQKVADLGLTAGPPAVLAGNRLAVIVPAGNPKAVRGVTDLVRSDLRVGMCGAEVPAGAYAREAARRAGIAIRSRSDEPNVKALVAKVLLGELDACIAYATDARPAGLEAIPLEPAHDVAATYPMAVLGCGTNAPGGRAFVALALGPAGREVLLQEGFVLP